MNAADIIILVLIIAAVCLAAGYLIKNKGAGCSGNCSGCAKDCKKQEKGR